MEIGPDVKKGVGMRAISLSKPLLSIVLPAKNEAESLAELIPHLFRVAPHAEIVVVNDGSTDATADVATKLGARVISHPYSLGNGAAIKTGAKAARGEIVVFLDADGQHNPGDVPRLIARLEEGYDMVVGSRSGASQANFGRRLANAIYNRVASYMTGHPILDLTSGFRAVRRSKFLEFLHLLPNGFSYPTTSTIAFFRAGYAVSYVPIEARRRRGTSHIRPLRDGARFFLIIFKVGTLYSPLKLFLPTSFAFFLLGICYYLYTYLTAARFTNMGALMLTTSILIFLIGLVSEQITQLIYSPRRIEVESSQSFEAEIRHTSVRDLSTGT